MSKEAMKLALEALKQMQAKANFECWNLEICDKAIKALEEALAKQEQGEHYKGVIEGVQKLFDDKRKPKQEQGEPVAWDLKDVTDAYKLGAKSQQRTWVGLTDEELEPLCKEWRVLFGSWTQEFAKAIEAKLKEKNT